MSHDRFERLLSYIYTNLDVIIVSCSLKVSVRSLIFLTLLGTRQKQQQKGLPLDLLHLRHSFFLVRIWTRFQLLLVCLSKR